MRGFVEFVFVTHLYVLVLCYSGHMAKEFFFLAVICLSAHVKGCILKKLFEYEKTWTSSVLGS